MTDRDTFAAGKGFTLVECIVVMAILATLVALLWPAISSIREAARRGADEEKPQLPQSAFLSTVQHDGHWFVLSSAAYTAPAFFQHHPDCPCRTRKAEEER